MIRKHLTMMLTVLALASALTGCGTTNDAATAAVSFSGSETRQVQANDYVSVNQAHQVATDTLYRYEDLRREWERAYSDYEKDRIENHMLKELTGALTDIRQIASNGYGYDARRVYDLAQHGLDNYEQLRYRWEHTYSLREKREIVNDMLTMLTYTLKEVQRVRPQA